MMSRLVLSTQPYPCGPLVTCKVKTYLSIYSVRWGNVHFLTSTSVSFFNRLQLTPFTIPVALDTFYLWIDQPLWNGESLTEDAQKVLAPFSTSLWLAILGCVMGYALLSVLLAPLPDWHESEFHKLSTRKKIKVTVKSAVDSTLNSWSFFMGGGGGGYDMETATMAQKILTFGFSFMTFVAVTAYTANLAAFLTLTGAPQYVATMAEAEEARMPICTLSAVQTELILMHPEASFIFCESFTDMLERYDKGDCQALLMSWLDVRGVPPTAQEFCSRDLVSTGAPVFKQPVAFPANPDIVGGLSFYIAEAESRGITFDWYLEKVHIPCNLNIELSDKDSDDLMALTPTEMILPLLVFVACSLLAILSRISSVMHAQRKKKRNKESAIYRAQEPEQLQKGDEIASDSGQQTVLGKREEEDMTMEMMKNLLESQNKLITQLLDQRSRTKDKGPEAFLNSDRLVALPATTVNQYCSGVGCE